MNLRYVPFVELERIRALELDPVDRAEAFADACRLNVLYMVERAGSGHLGTSFSCLDVLSWLQLEVLEPDDRYFSSKGHDAPALYAVLAGLGRIDFDLIHRLRRLGGLPGHPDLLTTPEVVTNTGSLGMGISKARGFVLADRLAGQSGRVFVLTGDGELQEGQFWESLQPTANRRLGEITAIVDHNKLQSDTWVDRVSALGDLEAKIAAFGWEVGRCDGNDLRAFSATLADLAERGEGKPKLLIADTVKGAGVSFMEPSGLEHAETSLYRFHSGAPDLETYERALAEITERLNRRLGREVELTEVAAPARSLPKRPQRLIAAWSDALVSEAEREPRLVALDGDLRLDCGLVEFQKRFPERFFECGIAEQDMVSQAGAMALAGLIPVVHSFACFLSTRANEQIFNNATEGTKVIYHGSLAGIVPGGPGHSHQSVRDIALFGSVPGMAVIEPYCDEEVARALEWAVREATDPVYLRLVSVPWELPFEPSAAQLQPGRGTVLREDVCRGAAGPVLVSQAWLAAEALAAHGVDTGVIALPWHRGIDGPWLAEAAGGAELLCLDNHVVSGGQGDAIRATGLDCRGIGVDRVPACGTNDEVLKAHHLDAASIVDRVVASRRVLT